MPHVLNGIHRNSMFRDERGSNDMAVLNQVCFQTYAIPNRILFQERNGVTTRLLKR